MKRLLTLAVLLASLTTIGQSDSLQFKHKTLKLTLSRINSDSETGYLTAIKDSSLEFTARAVPFGIQSSKVKSLQQVGVPDISYVKISRKGSVGKGLLIGTLTGAFIGIAAGYISGDDRIYSIQEDPYGLRNLFQQTAKEKATALGVLGGLGGGITGAIIGAFAHKKFIIAGKKENFDNMKATVLEKMYRKS